MTAETPEKTIRDVVDACADCEVCRDMMETCLFFPELYRLWDREKETGDPVPPADLRRLADLCNCCGLCSCADIRENIIKAKTGYVEREGMPPALRLLEDVATVGKICGALPRLSNALLQHPGMGRLVKRAAGIHPDRNIPEFPESSFFRWAAGQGLAEERPLSGRGVVFFAGCTGGYLFPEVPRAAVTVLQRIGVSVRVPAQGCCGMPSLLEGDRNLTLRFAESNLDTLTRAVDEGRDIVTACPTCGYMLKTLLPQGAWFSEAWQTAMGGDDRHIVLPDTDRSVPGKPAYRKVSRALYKSQFGDTGYFSSLDPMDRIKVAEHTHDLGEYLERMADRGRFNMAFDALPCRAVYYPPCHLREQEIGHPWVDLLRRIPNLEIETVAGAFDCCGMAGIMGFKKNFHEESLRMGAPLMDRISALNPDRIITDCLSCRIQFRQMADLPVAHPVEIISLALEKS